MKNSRQSEKLEKIFSEIESLSLDDYVSGSGKRLYARVYCSVGGFQAGDLVVVNCERKPGSTDFVIIESDGRLLVKNFKEIKPFEKPLRLVAKNGKPVNGKAKSAVRFEIIGVITHVIRTLVNSKKQEE